MNYKIVILIFCLLVTSGCAVNPTRHREARLMPKEVAKKIIASHVDYNWAEHPKLQAALVWHPLCSDTNFYDLDYEHMQVAWDSISSVVEIQSDKKMVGFLCGTILLGRIHYSTIEVRDDIIDALVSMGAKVSVR